jgi:hypothetical protein
MTFKRASEWKLHQHFWLTAVLAASAFVLLSFALAASKPRLVEHYPSQNVIPMILDHSPPPSLLPMPFKG